MQVHASVLLKSSMISLHSQASDVKYLVHSYLLHNEDKVSMRFEHHCL